MQQIIGRESLQRFYGKGVHLYEQGIHYRGWFIVPWTVKSFYTVSCFCPKGKRYISWSQHMSLEAAIMAGRIFVRRRVREVSPMN